MSDVLRHFERLADIVINGRKADAADPVVGIKAPISMVELIERKTSIVRCGEKRYRVVVEEVVGK